MSNIQTSKTLDKIIREGKMPRREFLEYFGKAALGMAAGGALTDCKSPNSPDDKTKITFTVYNHTQGEIRKYDSGDITNVGVFTKNISDLGVSGVDTMRWAVREPGFGKLIGSGKDGIIRLGLPATEVEYDLFLFNTGNNADYAEMDAQGAYMLNGRHDFRTYRQDWDGQTGDENKYPQRVWTGNSLPEIGGNPGAMVQVDSIMNPANTPIKGSIFASETPINGADFAYGYGDSDGGDGGHYGGRVTVNADKLNYYIQAMVAIGVRETIENMWNVQNLSQGLVNQGIVRPSTKDRMCYLLAMTQKN
jgi:hypothetical protein